VVIFPWRGARDFWYASREASAAFFCASLKV
jgi:hypothetical protein